MMGISNYKCSGLRFWFLSAKEWAFDSARYPYLERSFRYWFQEMRASWEWPFSICPTMLLDLNSFPKEGLKTLSLLCIFCTFADSALQDPTQLNCVPMLLPLAPPCQKSCTWSVNEPSYFFSLSLKSIERTLQNFWHSQLWKQWDPYLIFQSTFNHFFF